MRDLNVLMYVSKVRPCYSFVLLNHTRLPRSDIFQNKRSTFRTTCAAIFGILRRRQNWTKICLHIFSYSKPSLDTCFNIVCIWNDKNEFWMLFCLPKEISQWPARSILMWRPQFQIDTIQSVGAFINKQRDRFTHQEQLFQHVTIFDNETNEC